MLVGEATQAVHSLIAGSGLLSTLLRRGGSSSSSVFAPQHLHPQAFKMKADDDTYHPRKGHEAQRPRLSKSVLVRVVVCAAIRWECLSLSGKS